MAERPYMSLGVVGLQEMFSTTTDTDLLQSLRYELTHRRSKAASKLLMQVNEKLGEVQEEPGESSVWKLEYANLSKRHDLLRATFTLEGEILARWGMTGSIPRELEEKIFEYWLKNMTPTDIDYGRTKSQLGSDIERLKIERKGMNPKAIINVEVEE